MNPAPTHSTPITPTHCSQAFRPVLFCWYIQHMHSPTCGWYGDGWLIQLYHFFQHFWRPVPGFLHQWPLRWSFNSVRKAFYALQLSYKPFQYVDWPLITTQSEHVWHWHSHSLEKQILFCFHLHITLKYDLFISHEYKRGCRCPIKTRATVLVTEALLQ